MKNLHLIETQKPSRLISSVLGHGLINNCFTKSNLELIQARYQNIYITSDEDIKEEDWCLDLRFNTVIKITTSNIEDCKIGFYEETLKKIILTTDKDLDGVQAIDNEFLQWFVKNPICEEVELFKSQWVLGTEDRPYYKIIIPKEEPKQETLEEAAEKYYENNKFKSNYPHCPYSFKDGAKWQQERMYSEEQKCVNCIQYTLDNFFNGKLSGLSAKEIFQQFKKQK